MKLTPATARAVRRLALDVVLLDGEQDPAPSLGDMAQRAKALLDGPLRERSVKRAPRSVEAPPEPPRRKVVADLRAAVLKRCGEDCEFCGASLRIGGFELHHVLSGPDRRAEERPETVAGVCLFCHRQYHRGDVVVMEYAQAWAHRLRFKDALRAITRRLDKLTAQHPEETP